MSSERLYLMMANHFGNAQFLDLLDLVLVKHENFFYRGKVIDYDEDDFVVHFLDYGYTKLMARKSIYQWHPMWNLVPGTNLLKKL